ncbi:MAG: carboxybiotin decarboxylase [Petroclostridium sp.]|jgi:oxaloacetate decarboxylase beta subunit|uniref:sodium ion-translocating decarboxylase subunit beta n=1 Tax=Petroclostridium xylanilyticum TaxID=1792311 RepID=UPI000B99005A|nr:sodium ion-translocating decarboxylase subunit beta [Petroclostridium xylanilyticum]MBZ4646338.1 glutaconyl-CoA decarboxylase subunit beta [Clostridia bacterium]MDK2810589.1 carboxybiotin decarboxylase [Petroclostridium sp.]
MEQFAQLFQGVIEFHWQYLVMYVIGGILIYLAIKKDYEPMLLLPIGFGAILVNLPLSSIWEYEGAPGVLQIFFKAGILTEIFPVLIFVAVGAMIDFTPLLKNPKMLFFGAAAQFGIFFTVLMALFMNKLIPSLGFDLKTAASIGIIGAADGPTSIFVASKFAERLIGPISVAAYSYMSLVPIIQPPVIRALTTKKERMIRMEYREVKVSKTVRIAFPIVITIIAGIIAPISVPLVGLLMFGNLIREAGVLERLSKAAQNELANLVTLLLGITIGATMHYEKFLQKETIIILAMGLVAFVFDTAGGVIFAKIMNLFSKEKVNPMVGAAGISAFPMSARIIQKMAKQEDPHNFVLMQAVSANVAGQLGSIVAGGMVLALVPWLLSL